nr:hypothetical protein [Nocardia caishijiensis]
MGRFITPALLNNKSTVSVAAIRWPLGARGEIGQIQDQSGGLGPRPGGAYGLDRFVELDLIAFGQDHPCAARGQCTSSLPSDSAVGAGEQGGAAGLVRDVRWSPVRHAGHAFHVE